MATIAVLGGVSGAEASRCSIPAKSASGMELETAKARRALPPGRQREKALSDQITNFLNLF
jgi:hypothetical protein